MPVVCSLLKRGNLRVSGVVVWGLLLSPFLLRKGSSLAWSRSSISDYKRSTIRDVCVLGRCRKRLMWHVAVKQCDNVCSGGSCAFASRINAWLLAPAPSIIQLRSGAPASALLNFTEFVVFSQGRSGGASPFSDWVQRCFTDCQPPPLLSLINIDYQTRLSVAAEGKKRFLFVVLHWISLRWILRKKRGAGKSWEYLRLD